jgi:hypothetical protein
LTRPSSRFSVLAVPVSICARSGRRRVYEDENENVRP